MHCSPAGESETCPSLPRRAKASIFATVSPCYRTRAGTNRRMPLLSLQVAAERAGADRVAAKSAVKKALEEALASHKHELEAARRDAAAAQALCRQEAEREVSEAAQRFEARRLPASRLTTLASAKLCANLARADAVCSE